MGSHDPQDPSAQRARVKPRSAEDLLREENRNLREVLHVVDRCRELAPCLEPGKVYPVTLDLLLEALSRPRGLALFHRTTVPLSDSVAFRGFSEAQTGTLRELLVEQKPVETESFETLVPLEVGPLHDTLRSVGIEAGTILAVPVAGETGEAGVCFLLEDGRDFDERELELAALIRSYAVGALHNAEAYQRAKERAFIDDVTEVYNARYLVSATETEVRRAQRYEHPLSVLFLDLDRFKLVNDRYGHLVGSQTLRNLSQLLLGCVRQVDTLARYGGDEFTILLTDTAHKPAMAVAERIRRSVEEYLFEVGRGGNLRLTISIGVASFPDHADDRESLLDAADKAMYRAKSKGRNRVCSAGDLES